jgi:hypothetical protein
MGTKKKKPIVKSQSELNKMTEVELVAYASTLGLVLDLKGTKASKIQKIIAL